MFPACRTAGEAFALPQWRSRALIVTLCWTHCAGTTPLCRIVVPTGNRASLFSPLRVPVQSTGTPVARTEGWRRSRRPGPGNAVSRRGRALERRCEANAVSSRGPGHEGRARVRPERHCARLAEQRPGLLGSTPGEWPPLRQATSSRADSGTGVAGAVATGHSRCSPCWANQLLHS